MKKNKEQEKKMGKFESLRKEPAAQCDFFLFILYSKKRFKKMHG